MRRLRPELRCGRALEGAGATGAGSLDERLERPRAVWVIVPAGDVTEQTVRDLRALMEPGDVIIDVDQLLEAGADYAIASLAEGLAL